MSKRFLCAWAGSGTKPAIYHAVSRIVDRRFVLGDDIRRITAGADTARRSGEAIRRGAKGNGKKSTEGMVRACMSHKGAGFEAEMLESRDNETVLPDLGMAGMLGKRVRYLRTGR